MDIKDLKPTLLLALAFFMASAPNPDSEAIAEMTAGFIVPASETALQADMLPLHATDEIVIEAEEEEQVAD